VELKKADIILVHGASVLDTLVGIVTKSPWTHCAMVVDPERYLTIEASAFTIVRYRPLSTFKNSSLIVRVPDLTEEQRDKIVLYAQKQLGKKYDYKAIFDEFERYEFGKAIGPEKPGRFICSSLVAAAYKSAGIDLTRYPLASPDDIYKSEKVTPVGRF
jgi:uncharacterized protein YycO